MAFTPQCTVLVAKHRVRIIDYLEEKNLSCKPSIVCWLSFLAMRCVIRKLNILFKALLGSAILGNQQTVLFVQLIQSLCERVFIEGALNPQQIESWASTSGCRSGSFAISSSNVELFFTEPGFLEALAFT